ncbi:hypothetical protein VARIO8X_130205 [Burkholderiales bacterium 8X]|nr:hypothetical protein VARIO8X_130205 [Burkholderiales bacterium 8X]
MPGFRPDLRGLVSKDQPFALSERTQKPSLTPVFECLLTPTAEDPLVRAMCNASPSAIGW